MFGIAEQMPNKDKQSAAGFRLIIISPRKSAFPYAKIRVDRDMRAVIGHYRGDNKAIYEEGTS